MKVVMPGITINDLDSDGFVNQREAEASITGLTFTAGSDTALITERDFDVIVAALDDGPSTTTTVRSSGSAARPAAGDADDAEVKIEVQGDVEVEENDN